MKRRKNRYRRLIYQNRTYFQNIEPFPNNVQRLSVPLKCLEVCYPAISLQTWF